MCAPETLIFRSTSSNKAGVSSVANLVELEGTFFSHFNDCLLTSPQGGNISDAARVDGGQR